MSSMHSLTIVKRKFFYNAGEGDSLKFNVYFFVQNPNQALGNILELVEGKSSETWFRNVWGELDMVGLCAWLVKSNGYFTFHVLVVVIAGVFLFGLFGNDKLYRGIFPTLLIEPLPGEEMSTVQEILGRSSSTSFLHVWLQPDGIVIIIISCCCGQFMFRKYILCVSVFKCRLCQVIWGFGFHW